MCVYIYIYPNFKLPLSVQIIDHFYFLPYIYNFQNLYRGHMFLESEIHIPIKREKGIESYRGLRMAWHCHLEGLGSCYY